MIFAPTTLPVLWQAYKEELSIKDDLMTTVYHFGFSEVTGLIHSFAYRSTNNFRSEQIPYGLRYKPKCTIPENPSPEHITDMMESQRSIQASKPEKERLYIGGEIQIHHLTKDGSSVYTSHRFDDYERDEKAIYDNFNVR